MHPKKENNLFHSFNKFVYYTMYSNRVLSLTKLAIYTNVLYTILFKKKSFV